MRVPQCSVAAAAAWDSRVWGVKTRAVPGRQQGAKLCCVLYPGQEPEGRLVIDGLDELNVLVDGFHFTGELGAQHGTELFGV